MISQMTPSAIQQIDPISRALSSLSASSLSSLVASVDEAIRNDLEAFRGVFFIFLVASTIVVMAGVVLEEAEEWMPHLHRIIPVNPITEYRWAKQLVKLGWILIVVGVAGEGIFEVYVSRTDSILGKFDNVLIDDARKESSSAILGAATANMQVAEARQRTAELEKESAQLRKDAESEHLARVQVEAAVAFRSLNDHQKRDIGGALSRFGNITGVSMWFANGSPEAELFADDIAEALRFAHIHTTNVGGVIDIPEGGKWDGPIKLVTVISTGVDISSTSNTTSRELADAIRKELVDRGFDATTRVSDQLSKDNKPLGPIVWITVLARPKGPQGEYKLQAEREAKAKSSTKTTQ